MTFQTLLTHPAIQALGWAVLHFIWQGVLLAAVLFLANTVTKSPRTRYLTGCAVMLLMPVVFIATTLRSEQRPPVPTLQYSFTPELYIAPLDTTPHAATGHAATAASIPIASPRFHLDTIPGWIAFLWLAGVAAFSIFTAAGWLRVQRMKRRGLTPPDSAWLQAMESLRHRLQVSRPVRLCISALAEVPTVIGWIRPCILLPVSALTGLDESQLRAILAHELAHIRRYDYLVNLLQNAIETLLFYHPAVWWVSRRIREEREHCCDDLAVEVCGDVMVYAGALAHLEELRSGAPQPALAATGGNLLARIQRLMGPRTDKSPHRVAGSIGAMTTAALVITAAIGASHAPGSLQEIHAQSPAPKVVQAAPTPSTPAIPTTPVEIAQLPPAPTPKTAPAPAAAPAPQQSAGSVECPGYGGGSGSQPDRDGNRVFTFNPPFVMATGLPGAPFSGQQSSVQSQTLANGGHLARPAAVQPMMYRDSQGRTRFDAQMSPPTARGGPQIQRLPEIMDSVAGYHYILDDYHKIAYRIKACMWPVGAGADSASLPPAAVAKGITQTTEDLGTQSMSGVTVTGTRYTTTFPPGTYQGNDGPVTRVEEDWRSAQFGLNFLTKNVTPDGRESTQALANFTAGEPDPALFHVPAGYQIVDESEQFSFTIPPNAP